MVQHVDITDPYIHECKGVDAATSGMIQIADGLGSATWTLVTQYGGMCFHDGDGTTEINNIGTTAQKITAFDANMPSTGVTPDSATDNDLTIPFSGTYAVNFSACLATVAAGDAGDYNIRLRVNGSEPSSPGNLGVQRSFSGSGDLGSMGFFGFIDLTANDLLTVWIESDEAGDTDDLGVHELQFWAYLVKRS